MTTTTSARDLTKIAPLWGVTEVAQYLNVRVQTVYSWRARGVGPVASRVGKHLRWDPDDVVAWVRQQKEAA
jgi:excisionase family DNA binding protein